MIIAPWVGLRTSFRRFTSLLELALTRIDKTRISSVFNSSIIAILLWLTRGVSLVRKPSRDGHFFLQTNKLEDIYIVARDLPGFTFLSCPKKRTTVTQTEFGFGG